MLRSSHSSAIALAGIFAVTFVAQTSVAQVLAPQGSGTISYFASQSEAYQDSDPTGQLFGFAGPGPYTAAAPIPAVPGAPAPGIAPAPGNNFSTNGAGGYTALFNDLLGTTVSTAGQSTLDDQYTLAPSFTSDMAITIPAFRLAQDPNAPGYAYLQSSFGSNYLITANPGLAANPNPAFPALISGSSSAPGLYAQFDAEIEYSWTPVTIVSSGLISATGPTVSLGTLNWTFFQPGGGPFGGTILSTGGLAATPAGDGIMSLTGHAWAAVDPQEISVTLLPEPGSITALAIGALLLSRRRRIA